MSASGRGPFGTAMLGFAITAIFVSYQMLTDSQSAIHRDVLYMVVFIVLCPPSLLSLAIHTELGSNNFYVLWIVIATLNGALYAGIRLLVSRHLHR